jgi:hypothetical protein
VQRALPLDEQEVALRLRHRVVADALGDDHQVALVQFHRPLLQLDAQMPLQDEEQLVLLRVAVPGQGAWTLATLR